MIFRPGSRLAEIRAAARLHPDTMHITLRHLEVFEAVARCASISRAAAELRLTQPVVSMQMKQLEGQIGLPLLEQVGKRMFITEAGRERLSRARDIAARRVGDTLRVRERRSGTRAAMARHVAAEGVACRVGCEFVRTRCSSMRSAPGSASGARIIIPRLPETPANTVRMPCLRR
jgi:hypothetical protein